MTEPAIIESEHILLPTESFRYSPKHLEIYISLKHLLRRALSSPFNMTEEDVGAARGFMQALSILWNREGLLCRATAREFYTDFIEIKKFMDRELEGKKLNPFQEGILADFHELIRTCDKTK